MINRSPWLWLTRLHFLIDWQHKFLSFQTIQLIKFWQLWVIPTLSHGNSYIFYEVANLYELVRPHSYNLSKPQWRVGLGAGLGVGHSYKFIRIGNS